MFKTLRNAWSIADLRKKLIFTMLILLLYRIGNVIPVPFVDTGAMSDYFNSSLNNTIFGLYNAMSGSAFSRASVLALGIQPYINASIIIQLLTIAIPALERMAKEEGEAGKKKIERITRYTTVGLGLLLGFAYWTMISKSGYDILSGTAANSPVLSAIVMYDASGVRHETGKQGKTLNMIIVDLFSSDPRYSDKAFKELVGHTKMQVLIGALVGIGIGVACYFGFGYLFTHL